MDPKEIARLIAILESRRIASSVVGAAVIIGATVAVLHNELLRAARQAPALGSSAVVTTILLGALAFGYSVTLLLLGGLGAIGRSVTAVVRRRGDRQRAETERKKAEAKREATRRTKAERLRLVLPHLSSDAHETLRRLQRAGDQGLPLKHGDTALTTLSELGFAERQAPLDSARSVYAITAIACPVVEPFLIAEREKQIRSALEDITPSAARLLALFALPEPGPDEPAHPWIEHAVYSTVYDLERAKILARKPGRDSTSLRAAVRREGVGKCDERLCLTVDAVPFVETLVLRRPVLRTSVNLDWSQIASGMASGSGARPMGAGIPYPMQHGGPR